MFAIADVIGEDWPQRVREAAAKLAPREADSHGTTLLADIKAVFDARTGEWADRMFSEMLADALASIEGGSWAEYGKARKPITKNQLARLLSGFKVTPDTVWIGRNPRQGYQRHQFEDVWTRHAFGKRQSVRVTAAYFSPKNVRTESALTFQNAKTVGS